MKKIFMLLIAAGTFTIASAQQAHYHKGKQDYSYTLNQKQDGGLQSINHEYDFKIAVLKQNRWVNNWEKSKQISQLQRQRDGEIARMQFSFERNNHDFSDHGYADNKKHKW